MRYSVVSIFPDMVDSFTDYGLLGKAKESKKLEIVSYDLRDYTEDKHRKVDDRPFGGGAGMVMKPEPLFNVIEHIKREREGKVILFSAYGERLNQQKAKGLSEEDHLILLCGRYEGVDQRVIDELVDEEISIGEYVLMGGEAASLVLMESVSRMLPGVIGNYESVETDSFYHEEQYGFPQYTQPRDFRGVSVPEVLLNGHHANIDKWRKENQKHPQTTSSDTEE